MRGVWGVAAAALLFSGWSGVAPAADSPAAEPEGTSTSRVIPDLHLSVGETPGETSVRLPLASERSRLYGLLTPYLSLGSVTTLEMPGSNSLPLGLRRDPNALDDVRLGAGMALPLSGRTQLYSEYRFLRGRIDGEAGRGLLQREPDSADFRAGFSIRLD